MAVEIRIPTLGESVNEGVITRWLKQNGESVAADEIVLELETDKASMEIAAESAGELEILKAEGSTVQVGTVVGRINASASGSAEKRAKSAPVRSAGSPKAPPPKEPQTREAPVEEPPSKDAPVKEPPSKERDAEEPPSKEPPAELSPAVRKLVVENDLDPSAIERTGPGGRLSKEDVLRHLESGGGKRASAGAAAKDAAPDGGRGEAAPEPEAAPKAEDAAPRPALGPRTETPAAPAQAGTRRVPMTRLRQRIAERLVEAQRTAAILTTFNEIDMSAVMTLRKRYKEQFQKRHGVGLGFVSLFARASALALREMPIVNASIEGSDVVYHESVNLGIAVATDRGLVVPIVHGAEAMSLAETEKAVGELAALARNGKLTPDHLAGGTFSITNGGIFGSLLSTPILNPPNSAILGMHKIEERPVAIAGQVEIRPMMYVALSYDHRLIDGEQAVTFLVRVKERLEDPARMLLEV